MSIASWVGSYNDIWPAYFRLRMGGKLFSEGIKNGILIINVTRIGVEFVFWVILASGDIEQKCA